MKVEISDIFTQFSEATEEFQFSVQKFAEARKNGKVRISNEECIHRKESAKEKSANKHSSVY